MSESDSNALIPVRMLTQYVYCKRLAYLEWVQGEFEYNTEVAEGKYAHRIVDQKSGMQKAEQDTTEKIHVSSIMLSDTRLGLISKMDLLELKGNMAIPVEYKRGQAPQGEVYDDHLVQVCAQGMLLRANGYECTKGVIYYVASKKRIEVMLDENVVSKTLRYVEEIKEMSRMDSIPPPLVDSPKCHRCSMVGICLPDETNMFARDGSRIDKDQVRRMYPVRKDSMPVYVQEQGARISKSGDCVHVKLEDKIVKKIRMIDISEITVFGNVQITTQAVRELCERNIPICYMTYGGWLTGMTFGMDSKNIDLRISQHKKYGEQGATMKIAREIVFAKIKNCSTMLRRNHKSRHVEKIDEIDRLAEKARVERQYQTLLGIEGMAARMYFSEFSGMIKNEQFGFDFSGRNRRPPMDPVNAILSFLYSMLTRQAMTTIRTVGLDPYLGFLHKPKYGKPALALDLIEEFRPIVADSVCITLINGGEISESDFTITKFGTSMTSEGRRRIISAYERRMDSTITHPFLGYAASYRRIMETQARLLSRHILGEIPEYPAFRTR